MAEQLPIRFQQLAQLQALGVNAASVGFQTLTLESERFVCVREQVNGQNQVVIIDLANNNDMMRRPITAESVITHPTTKIIALRAQRQLQVFNLETKTKISSHLMHDDITFWKWIDLKTIGIVTGTAVYHWSVENGSAPVKVFDRHANLAGCQIINYRTSSDGNWMVLIGISSQQGSVVGSMQLYSRARGVSQPIEGHAAAFAELQLDDAPQPTKLFAFCVRSVTGNAKIQIIEVDHPDNNPPFQKKTADMYFAPENPADFPVAMQVGKRFGVIYVLTKMGFIHIYDLETGICIFVNRISDDTVFITTDQESTSGVVAINKKGQVLSVTLDENTVVPYIVNKLGNTELALKLAGRGGLAGADDLCVSRFHQLFSSGAYIDAAKLAANSPRGILRTPDTIERFRQLPSMPNQLSPILQYFGLLLEKGGLNRYESLEMAKPILLQNRKPLLEKWLKEDKLECSEELGDFVKQYDSKLALSVYLRANVPNKVVLCFAENRQYDKIVAYAKTVGYTPDYNSLLYNIARTDPDSTVAFANALINDETGPLIDAEKVVDVLMSQNMLQQATSFLLDYLKENRPEHANLQTRVIEMNLIHAPQVADAIFGTGMLTHYDRVAVGTLCEKAGLYQRALEHYTDIHDIKRIIPMLRPCLLNGLSTTLVPCQWIKLWSA